MEAQAWGRCPGLPSRPSGHPCPSVFLEEPAASVGCLCFNKFSAPERLRNSSPLFSAGAVVHPLQSPNSDQSGASSTAPYNSQVTAKTCRGCRTRPLACHPCGSAPRPTLQSAVLAGKAWLLPGARRQAVWSQGERACGLQSAADAVHSLPLPPGCSGPGLSGNERCGAERALPENGRPCRASPSCFELGREEIHFCCCALAVILSARGPIPPASLSWGPGFHPETAPHLPEETKCLASCGFGRTDGAAHPGCRFPERSAPPGRRSLWRHRAVTRARA